MEVLMLKFKDAEHIDTVFNLHLPSHFCNISSSLKSQNYLFIIENCKNIKKWKG